MTKRIRRKLSEATKFKMRLAKLGNKNPMHGKHHSEETRAKISQSLSNRTMSDEQKKKISQALSGTAVVNKNGINKRIRKTELDLYISSGWIRGRVPKS